MAVDQMFLILKQSVRMYVVVLGHFLQVATEILNTRYCKKLRGFQNRSRLHGTQHGNGKKPVKL
jgi:hypothetical protein